MLDSFFRDIDFMTPRLSKSSEIQLIPCKVGQLREMSHIKFSKKLYPEVSLGMYTDEINFPKYINHDTGYSLSLDYFDSLAYSDMIKSARGMVLIIGVGLGYLAYNCIKSENVTSIVIQEDNKDLLLYFKKYIGCQLSTNKRIILITSGNLNSILMDTNFDTILVDSSGSFEDDFIKWITDRSGTSNYIYKYDSLYKQIVQQELILYIYNKCSGKERIYNIFLNNTIPVTDKIDLYFDKHPLKVSSVSDVIKVVRNPDILEGITLA